MEGNREEADRALHIARTHREQGKLTSSLKFANKSLQLNPNNPAATAFIKIVEREISSAASSSTAQATGAEAHPSAGGAHRRPGHGTDSAAKASTSTTTPNGSTQKREYTPTQVKLVTRIKACKPHDYYAVLSIEKTCSEDEVKRAYRKLALQLHPDKNGAPGADEAFKVVSKAFQVLSDTNQRAIYNDNPGVDPLARGGGGGGGGGGMGRAGMARGFGGGGMNGSGLHGEMDAQDLFNMFFGGGGGFGAGQPVFTTSFGGGGFGNNGFQNIHAQRARARARQATGAPDTPAPSWVQMLPILLILGFALLTILPSLFGFGPTPDPNFTYSPQQSYTALRKTHNYNIPYYVNQKEFESHPIWESIPQERRGEEKAGRYSAELRKLEQGIEHRYVSSLREECDQQMAYKQQRIQNAQGFFGIGADWEKIKQIEAEPLVSCQKLRQLGISNR